MLWLRGPGQVTSPLQVSIPPSEKWGNSPGLPGLLVESDSLLKLNGEAENPGESLCPTGKMGQWCL